MKQLLQNNCIMSVLYDDHTKSTGRVDFYGGEVYYGEIFDDIPKGQGSLHMTDTSVYKGEFDHSGLLRGKYTHFTLNEFSGIFCQDKLKHGKIKFRDGDLFKGTFGISKGKWIIEQGTLYDEVGAEVGTFNPKYPLEQIRSKLKVLYRNDQKRGFCIKYDYFIDFDSTTYSKMVISANGFSLTRQKDDQMNDIEKKRAFSLIPFEKCQISSKSETETIYTLPFGFNFSIKNDKEIGVLRFKQVENIHAEGVFDFNEKNLYFSGKLIKKGKVISTLKIQKTLFTKLSIKLDDRELRDLRSFYVQLIDLTDEKKYLPMKIGMFGDRNSDSANKTAFSNIVDGLKKENECQIF
jgi:hypothetical protein